MASKDVGWEHAKPVGGSRKIVRCNYCGKVVHGGITRMKQHLAHVSGQVEACPKASREVRKFMQSHLKQGKSERAATKKKKSEMEYYLRENSMYDNSDEDDDDVHEISEEDVLKHENKQLKRALRESRYMQFVEDQRRHSVSECQPTMPYISGIICEVNNYFCLICSINYYSR